jgi:hypothetical protein
MDKRKPAGFGLPECYALTGIIDRSELLSGRQVPQALVSIAPELLPLQSC